jgi:hypothetical protein
LHGFRISVSSSLLGGYDEPEILLSENHPVCPIGADVTHASRLYALSHILDVPVPYFFEDMPPEISDKGGKPVPGLTEGIEKKTSVDLFTKRETLELVRAYYRIKDPNVRKRLFGLVNSLAGA